MKILVTGPKGFVGSRIMDALHAVGAPPLREASEDNIRRIVDEAEPDVIIHTAAISDIVPSSSICCITSPTGIRT